MARADTGRSSQGVPGAGEKVGRGIRRWFSPAPAGIVRERVWEREGVHRVWSTGVY